MQYTIEARELTNGHAQRQLIVEASDADEAISRYVRESDAELVSFTKPIRGSESIATVKKEESVYLVRVYAA